MDARALRYFQAVAELGSYSRAAAVLRISQPALSRQVRRLEQELERPLFARHGHGVSLTDAGRLLLEHGQNVLRELDRARAVVRGTDSAPSGQLTLAVPPAAGVFLVPALARRVAAAFPNVFLKVIAGFSSTIHEWLVRGIVDVACLHDPLPMRGFDIVPLVREEVFLVGRPGTFPLRARRVRAEDLTRVPLILPSRPNASRRLLDSLVSARGLALDIRMEVDDSSLIRALLRDGAGFSLLSQGAFRSDVRHGDLAALPFRPAVHWPLALVVPANKPRAALVEALTGAIRATVCEEVASGAWPAALLRK